MAIRKVVGIETEYGIAMRGAPDPNPIAASSILINAYVSDLARRVRWDFEDESPGNDARGFAVDTAQPPDVETHLVNAVLTNGARYYVDHAHPEYSSPECIDALEAVRYDKAGEEILMRSMTLADRTMPAGQTIVVYKNNSDRKGNSYGTHENYLMDRSVPFANVVRHVMPHFITRQIYTGAGKVGTEAHTGDQAVAFQLTQRADFFEEEVGLETTLKRPIVNTRDEPHSDSSKYRRLHVIVGDANMSEIATLLKLGTTSFILSMIEDDAFGDRDYTLATPVHTLRQISYDTDLTLQVELADGRKMTALEMQWELFDLARKWADDRGLESVGEDTGALVMREWEHALTGLETDPMSLSDSVDWVAKYRLVDGYRSRHNLDWNDAKLAAMDLQYHDLRPEKSLVSKLGLRSVIKPEDVQSAITEPPRETRAYFRGKCLQKWGSAIAAANWDSVVFDLGTDPLRRVPMMEPLRGTAAHVDQLLEECETPAELLAKLGA